jgi:hypothetical protein
MSTKEKNCAFQYAKIIHGSIKIIEDMAELSIDEAKELWNKYFDDAAKWIYEGNTAEMAIWINMETPISFKETLQYISIDAESNGTAIWEKAYFPKRL